MSKTWLLIHLQQHPPKILKISVGHSQTATCSRTVSLKMDLVFLRSPSLTAACLCSFLPLAELYKTQSVASQPLCPHPKRGNRKELLVDVEPRGRQKWKVSSAPGSLHGQQQQTVQEQRTGHEEEGTSGLELFPVLSLSGAQGRIRCDCFKQRELWGKCADWREQSCSGSVVMEPSTRHPLHSTK